MMSNGRRIAKFLVAQLTKTADQKLQNPSVEMPCAYVGSLSDVAVQRACDSAAAILARKHGRVTIAWSRDHEGDGIDCDVFPHTDASKGSRVP